MKLPSKFTIYDLRFTIGSRSGRAVSPLTAGAPGVTRPAAVNPQSSIVNRQSRSGVALVITLIMLAVTLVMAVAFLAVANRERNAVSTTTDTTTARLAAESARAAAEAQVVANIMASGGRAAYDFKLLVSTNYQNGNGFVSGLVNPANVNYFDAGGNLLTGLDMEQNIANLLFLPRAPVFVKNRASGLNDFRFFLDLNRNGFFEANGWVAEFDSAGFTNGAFGNHTGDPEWIGVLERPDQPHGPNNKFIARYAFGAQPIGNSLDLNGIHNQVKNQALGVQDGFSRNQGVGTWELSLPAFLADLNTNQWNPPLVNYYQYLQPGNANTGVAFEDARALLKWRYNGFYNFLNTVDNLFPANAANIFANDRLDAYSDGPLQTTVNTNADFVADNSSVLWAGSDNPNRFHSLPSEVFGAANNLGNFPLHLEAAGKGKSTYDRYTFYRMLEQLGTDSVPESGKLNLNYSNAVVRYDNNGVVTSVAIVSGTETNLVPWRAVDFFHAAADRMLRLYTTNWYAADPTNYLRTCYGGLPNNTQFIGRNGYGLTNFPYQGMTNEVPAFGIGNIPVWVDGRFVYTPAVNRLLQMAANLYDASTNSFYPSVFRPIFVRDADNNVFIAGYTNLASSFGPNTISGTTDPQMNLPYEIALVADPSKVSSTVGKPIMANGANVNVYGVPWIIGAKKNLPGLNQFSMVNAAQVIRKLQVGRATVGGTIWTNQMNILSVGSQLGVSFWNSYANDYAPPYSGPLKLSIYVSDASRLVLTNSDHPGTPTDLSFSTNFTIPLTRWPGSKLSANPNVEPDPNSFVARNWTNQLISGLVYKTGSKSWATTNDLDPWEVGVTTLQPLPQFGLLLTNWLRAVIVDDNHVIDYVHLRGPINTGGLNGVLKDPDYSDQHNIPYLWSTNLHGSGTSYGIINQIEISSKNITPPASAQWTDLGVRIPGMTAKEASRVFFAAAFKPNSTYQYKNADGTIVTDTNSQLIVQAPYTATRTAFVPYLYQVNDPLVHYLANDLDAGKAGVWAGGNTIANGEWSQDNGLITASVPTPPSTEIVKGRYQPWGKVAPTTLDTSKYNFGNAYNLIYKDPLVWGSDYWNFPTNKYPTVGWMGRVHRGTPWQSVYLKSRNVLKDRMTDDHPARGTDTWTAWTGNFNKFDAANSAPFQDRLLFDVFTTALNENATRGQLSVNQPNLAAWSALFSGMVVITNTGADLRTTPSYTFTKISPAGVNGLNSALGQLVTSINKSRAAVGAFERKGDILSSPALTESSPFLHLSNYVNNAWVEDLTQKQKGISDEVYEWLPQQMLSLVSCPTGPRYVVYCYGQTLKPAPDGTVLNGPYFKMVTNYQVVAESAVRAVIRVKKQVTAQGTNYTTEIESYNPLPPD